VPSGFVLKLFQMVNGAPDEVISWLPQGDAFRISDLEKLEAETLPTYFRHSRFQSLVRQLNFYNFRKVNRERTFWVYRHPLFHRDKPQNLHLLRRRTCPGVDGRKHKPDYDIQTLETTENLEFPGQAELLQGTASAGSRATKSSSSSSVVGDSTASGSAATPSVKQSKGSRSKRTPSAGRTSKAARQKTTTAAVSTVSGEKESESSVEEFTEDSTTETEEQEEQPTSVKKRRPELSEKDIAKRVRMERLEQSLMVNHVAQRLEEYAKRAEGESGSRQSGISGKRGNRGGVVTPPSSSDTMKYHALTYDDEAYYLNDDEEDEVEEDGSSNARTCTIISKKAEAGSDDAADVDAENNGVDAGFVVTEGEDSDGDVSSLKSTSSVSHDGVNSSRRLARSFASIKMKEPKVFKQPPVKDASIISSVANKLSDYGALTPHIAVFCMATAPHDTDLAAKALEFIKSYHNLEGEFMLYRSALRPDSLNSESMEKLYEQATSDFIHDFKVFSVNHMQFFLSEQCRHHVLNESEVGVLKRSTDMWVESTNHFAY